MKVGVGKDGKERVGIGSDWIGTGTIYLSICCHESFVIYLSIYMLSFVMCCHLSCVVICHVTMRQLAAMDLS